MKAGPVESKKPVRILYVHNSADTYGASRSLLRLTSTINRARFEPVVIVPEEGDLTRQLRENKVEVFIYPHLTIIDRYQKSPAKFLRFIISVPRSILYLYRLIQKENIDLVHTNVAVIPTPALASFLAGVPHVWHIREFFGDFPILWKLYWRYMTTFSRRIIAVSKATADQFPRQDNVSVVHNGFLVPDKTVDDKKLRLEFRGRFKIENELVAGCVGRIKFQRKGQDVFVRAMALLKKQGHTVRGLIVGAPYAANEQQWQIINNLIAELGVEKEIILAGELKDVRPAYAAMDLFVLPSGQPEPFGGVVMEAMTMNLPVIATNIGGSLEQVEEGITGFLIPPNDPEALADRILRLSKDPELRKNQGMAGFQRLQNQFSLSKTTAEMEQIYEEILRIEPV